MSGPFTQREAERAVSVLPHAGKASAIVGYDELRALYFVALHLVLFALLSLGRWCVLFSRSFLLVLYSSCRSDLWERPIGPRRLQSDNLAMSVDVDDLTRLLLVAGCHPSRVHRLFVDVAL
jgi:hypothetical protein